jgi:hypothetical protein
MIFFLVFILICLSNPFKFANANENRNNNNGNNNAALFCKTTDVACCANFPSKDGNYNMNDDDSLENTNECPVYNCSYEPRYCCDTLIHSLFELAHGKKFPVLCKKCESSLSGTSSCVFPNIAVKSINCTLKNIS